MIYCPSCYTNIGDAPEHENGCALGMLLQTLADRGHWVTATHVSQLDLSVTDELWERFLGPAADFLEGCFDEQTAWEGEPDGLVARHLYRHRGARTPAAIELGEGLMRGDPRLHQAGYSKENALVGVKDAFRITHDVDELTEDEEIRVFEGLRDFERILIARS